VRQGRSHGQESSRWMMELILHRGPNRATSGPVGDCPTGFERAAGITPPASQEVDSMETLISVGAGLIGTMVGAAIAWSVGSRQHRLETAFAMHREFHAPDMTRSRNLAGTTVRDHPSETFDAIRPLACHAVPGRSGAPVKRRRPAQRPSPTDRDCPLDRWCPLLLARQWHGVSDGRPGPPAVDRDLCCWDMRSDAGARWCQAWMASA
jgi:hypothetical protein